MAKFLYAFFDLGPPEEIDVKRRKALESITSPDCHPLRSFTYDLADQLDRRAVRIAILQT
ncbi:hypothetical protein VCV18_012543 [Metarhizium anisopliae]